MPILSVIFFIWKRPDSNLNGETQISCTITEGEKNPVVFDYVLSFESSDG